MALCDRACRNSEGWNWPTVVAFQPLVAVVSRRLLRNLLNHRCVRWLSREWRSATERVENSEGLELAHSGCLPAPRCGGFETVAAQPPQPPMRSVVEPRVSLCDRACRNSEGWNWPTVVAFQPLIAVVSRRLLRNLLNARCVRRLSREWRSATERVGSRGLELAAQWLPSSPSLRWFRRRCCDCQRRLKTDPGASAES